MKRDQLIKHSTDLAWIWLTKGKCVYCTTNHYAFAFFNYDHTRLAYQNELNIFDISKQPLFYNMFSTPICCLNLNHFNDIASLKLEIECHLRSYKLRNYK